MFNMDYNWRASGRGNRFVMLGPPGNKNQPGRGVSSPTGGEMHMEVESGTRKDDSLPKLNQLLATLSSVESMLDPAKQELKSLSSKGQNDIDQAVKWKEKEDTLKATKSERDSLHAENVVLIKEKSDFEQKIQQYEEFVEKIKNKFGIKVTELKQAKENNEALILTLDNTKRDLDKVTKDNVRLSQTKNELMEKQRKTEVELSDTKSRLSKIMGQKLSDNNPNIADLSDQNRPTKLAERYQELYDNQWTDAFEAVEVMNRSFSEKQCIEVLLCILKDAKTFCEGLYEKQMQEVCRAVSLTPKTARDSLSEFTKKQVKDVLKGTVETSIPDIQKMFFQKNITNAVFQNAQVRPYIDECITICWLMSVQDPPVVLGKDPPTYTEFDTNFFKHYTKTGTQMDYVVWPSLYLHEGGPLLGKGVAQAKTRITRQRSNDSHKGTRDRAQDEAQINKDGNQLYGAPGEQTVQAYGETPNDPLRVKKSYPMYSQNESWNETRFDPQQWDKSKADQGASFYDTAPTTLSGAQTIGGRSGETYIRHPHMNLAQSTRSPAAYPQWTGAYQPLPVRPRAAWQVYTPNANDLKRF